MPNKENNVITYVGTAMQLLWLGRLVFILYALKLSASEGFNINFVVECHIVAVTSYDKLYSLRVSSELPRQK